MIRCLSRVPSIGTLLILGEVLGYPLSDFGRFHLAKNQSEDLLNESLTESEATDRLARVIT